jgi:hypothetical protein
MWHSRIGKAGWFLFLIVLLLWATSTVVAGPLYQDDVSPIADDVTPVPPLEVPTPLAPSPEELVGAAGVQAPSAIPSAQMNYQGYLTDASGQPLDGTFDMTFRLFDDPAAGSQIWGDEVHAGVAVSHGLFQVVLGETVSLPPSIFRRQLYLESAIGATVLPRQMLRATSYAMGLVGGAYVYSNSAYTTTYALYVVNDGGYGINVNAKGDGLYGIYNSDVTYSAEGYAGPDTEVWIPANNMKINSASLAIGHAEYNTYGEVRIEADAVGNVYAELPIQIERPYGRTYHLKSATVYYKTDAPNSQIIRTGLTGRNLSTGVSTILADDSTDYASTVYSSYTMTLDPPEELSTTNMLTNMQFLIEMSNVAGTVTIYAVRLTLDSSY